MPCDHVGGPELIEMAEAHFRETGVPATAWQGSRFRFTQNVEGGTWASVCTEIERRGHEWIVTKIDRRPQPASDSEIGFRVLREGRR